MLLDSCCLHYKDLDSSNHVAILTLLAKQAELPKVQREILMRYLSLAASEAKYTSLFNEPSLILEKVADIFSTKRLGGPTPILNESLIADFQTILEHLPVEKCGYIYDCILESINDDSPTKHYSVKIKLKLAEIVCKNFNFKDNRDMINKLVDNL